MGINRGFIDKKDFRNVYMTKKIVEEYDFKRILNQEEKQVLVQMVLNNTLLDESNNAYLSNLIKVLKSIGLDKQQIYGTIINLGINGSVIEKGGYSYKALLSNKDNVWQTIGEYKDEIETNVSEATIKTALSKNISVKDEERIKKYLEELGMDIDFIEQIETRNMYMAFEIIQEYNFERQLTKEEQRVLIQMILNNPLLNKTRPVYLLSTLMQNLQNIGLNVQETYGAVINLAISDFILDGKDYSYKQLLHGKKAFKGISQYAEVIPKVVTEETIEKARKKAEKMMKKALKESRKKGELSELQSTLLDLQELSPANNKIKLLTRSE